METNQEENGTVKMKTVKYMVEETVSQQFEIEVPENYTEEQTKEAIRQAYVDGDTVLEPGDLEFAKAHLLNDDNTYNINDDWTEIA